MKKIMFSDRFCLTGLVIGGIKTQTRRHICVPKTFRGQEVRGFNVCTNTKGKQYSYLTNADDDEIEGGALRPTWKVGEVVAIAQRYGDVINMINALDIPERKADKGWQNKMYVKAELMPHKIKITNVRMERLQDISVEDIRKEGIRYFEGGCDHAEGFGYLDNNNNQLYTYPTEQEAYAALIDNISGKGTWEKNPLVYVYEFELVK